MTLENSSKTQNGTLHYSIYKKFPKIGNSIKTESRAKWIGSRSQRVTDLFKVMKISKIVMMVV